MRSTSVREGGSKAGAMASAAQKRQCGRECLRERSARVLTGAEEVVWVTKSKSGGGTSSSVRGSGHESSPGSIRLSVRGNGDGSAAAVVEGVSGGSNRSVCGSNGASRRQQEQRQREHR